MHFNPLNGIYNQEPQVAVEFVKLHHLTKVRTRLERAGHFSLQVALQKGIPIGAQPVVAYRTELT